MKKYYLGIFLFLFSFSLLFSVSAKAMVCINGTSCSDDVFSLANCTDTGERLSNEANCTAWTAAQTATPPASVADSGNYGLDATAGAADLKKFGSSVPTLIGNVIGTGLAMIGVVFFVLMVYAGVLWMTARGNETTSKKAFDTIVAAAIGMVIVLASYALTNFVFTSVASQPPTPKLPNGSPCTNSSQCESNNCSGSVPMTCQA